MDITELSIPEERRFELLIVGSTMTSFKLVALNQALPFFLLCTYYSSLVQLCCCTTHSTYFVARPAWVQKLNWQCRLTTIASLGWQESNLLWLGHYVYSIARDRYASSHVLFFLKGTHTCCLMLRLMLSIQALQPLMNSCHVEESNHEPP